MRVRLLQVLHAEHGTVGSGDITKAALDRAAQGTRSAAEGTGVTRQRDRGGGRDSRAGLAGCAEIA